MQHSASRALALLKAMNLRPVSSVGELASATGISKPSVVRLLGILIEDGFVRRAARPGSYALTRDVLLLSSGFRDDSTLARIAAPQMDALTQAIDWPCALGVFEAGAMVVRHSTIPVSPLAWYRTTLFMRLPLLSSAMGQVYLASCSASARARLIEAEERGGLSLSEQSNAFFERVRSRGFGLRAATADHPTFSISVPIQTKAGMAGALSVTIYARAMTVDQAVEIYLARLKSTARDIAFALQAELDLADRRLTPG